MGKADKKELNNQAQEKNETKNNETQEAKTEKSKYTRKKIVLIIAAIALLIMGIIFRGNYLEMREMGDNYLTIFWQNAAYFAITFILNFVFLFCSFFFTNKTIRKGVKIFFEEEDMEVPKFPNKSISFIIALIGSTISSKFILTKLLLCFSNSQFGITDSIFNLDISFFVFQKPLIQLLIIYLLVVVIATLAYGLIYSIVILNRSVDRNITRNFSKSQYTRDNRLKSKANSCTCRCIYVNYNDS